MVTTSGTEALYTAVQALCDPGDEARTKQKQTTNWQRNNETPVWATSLSWLAPPHVRCTPCGSSVRAGASAVEFTAIAINLLLFGLWCRSSSSSRSSRGISPASAWPVTLLVLPQPPPPCYRSLRPLYATGRREPSARNRLHEPPTRTHPLRSHPHPTHTPRGHPSNTPPPPHTHTRQGAILLTTLARVRVCGRVARRT